MKMEPARVVIDLDDYETSENQIVPVFGDYRLERRWKRRELSNKRVKSNHHDSGTRLTTKSCGNVASLRVQGGHILEDEMDEDYKLFLVTYNPDDIDVVSDGKVDGSDNYIDIGYDGVHYDHQYRMLLEEEERFHNDPELELEMMKGSKQRDETKNRGNRGSDSMRKQTNGPIKSQMNMEAKRRLSSKRPHEDMSGVPKNNCHIEMKGSKQRHETRSQAYKGSDLMRKQTSDPMKSQENLEAKRGLSKKRPHEYVFGVPKNNCHTEMAKGSKQSGEFGNKGTNSMRKQRSGTMKSQLNSEAKRGLSKKRPHENVSIVPENNCESNMELDVVDEDYQIYLNSLMQNSQVSDRVLSEFDEDYLQYLNSIRIVDGEVEYMPERNTSETDMPGRNTSETDMPGRNTSETDMPGRNTSETDMPERNTLETDMPERNTSETDMPKRNTLETDMPERISSETDMLERIWSKTDMPKRNTLEIDMPERISLETDMPERICSKIDMPERIFSKIDMPERIFSKIDMPERIFSKIDMPERNTSEIDMPERNTSEIDMPERNTSETDMPERISSETYVPERISSKTYVPERISSETYVPERISSETYVPERISSETYVPERISLETYMPERISSETYMLERISSETDMCERNSSEASMCERNTSKTDMPKRNTLPTGILERNISNDIPKRNISNTVNVDGDNNSSEPDLILLEPDQIHKNTPFVSSKTYDPSWFETEMNPKDNWQLSAYDHSQFRRRLMNDLQRPYDQEECERLLIEVRLKRKTERHVETRQGVVKSYCTTGVNKSYLELYPDLAKAIAKFKQPERVLFLLRGFIFWLQNLTHEGIFRPWLDNLCLQILREM